jgi:hypothetical protein
MKAAAAERSTVKMPSRRCAVSNRTSLPSPMIPAGSVARYRDRIYDSPRQDPYQAKGKYAEPAVCRVCGAVYRGGRWQWSDAPPGAHEATCPACQRVRDRLPAGYLTLEGGFLAAHRADIESLLRHEADHERSEHPMNRIIAINTDDDRTVVTTTDIHLPQRLGKAIARAFQGTLDVEYADSDYTVRARWQR